MCAKSKSKPKKIKTKPTPPPKKKTNKRDNPPHKKKQQEQHQQTTSRIEFLFTGTCCFLGSRALFPGSYMYIEGQVLGQSKMFLYIYPNPLKFFDNF